MKSAPFNTRSTAPSASPFEPKLASVAALIAERRTNTATWANPTRQRLRFARCCYGHLAGLLPSVNAL